MKHFLLYFSLTLLLVASLFMIAYKREMIVKSAPRYLLETAPVDPRDFFRGEYVRLGYNFSDAKLFTGLQDLNEKCNRYHKKMSAYLTFDVTDSNYLIPKAFTIEKSDPPFMHVYLSSYYNESFHVTSPINKFFLEQGKGPIIENAITKNPVVVELALSEDGTPVLTNLFYTDSEGKKQQVNKPSSL